MKIILVKIYLLMSDINIFCDIIIALIKVGVIFVFKYTVGDILKSKADCLVNTVNCEGYMGKGIAYQFKMQYPENNIDYMKACRNKDLQIGKLHKFKERGKVIVNFPTKDKWRKKSELVFIEKGLDCLVKLLPKLGISSISIPPLGCGNGGLNWIEVKVLIENKLKSISNDFDIIIYEPSSHYDSTIKIAPKINTSHLVLMQIKLGLKKFNSLRLQKAAFFMNSYLDDKYFKFSKHKFGPYAHSVSILSKEINEFQKFHNTKSTQDAYVIALNTCISNHIEKKMNSMSSAINKAIEFVNNVLLDKELECISTIVYIIDNIKVDRDEDIIREFKAWSVDKAKRFTDEEIKEGINYLIETKRIYRTLIGYRIIKN